MVFSGSRGVSTSSFDRLRRCNLIRFDINEIRYGVYRALKIINNWSNNFLFPTLEILFTSNHNIHKSLYGLCFWASDPLIEIFYQNPSIKGSETQKQWPYELL